MVDNGWISRRNESSYSYNVPAASSLDFLGELLLGGSPSGMGRASFRRAVVSVRVTPRIWAYLYGAGLRHLHAGRDLAADWRRFTA